MTKIKGQNVRIKFGTKKFLADTSCDIDESREELDATTKDGVEYLVGNGTTTISGNGLVIVESGTPTDSDYAALRTAYEAGTPLVAQVYSTDANDGFPARQCTGVLTSLKTSADKSSLATVAFTFKGNALAATE